ncbi:hypothetical protein ECG_02099 [Echinococcus granulosus]|nr:hypothetical protein ECG_02099 [Echinococcus granulosus]
MSLSATFTGLLDSKAQKDTQVSPEILKLVEDLKKYFADQRRQRDEIINISTSLSMTYCQNSRSCNVQ